MTVKTFELETGEMIECKLLGTFGTESKMMLRLERPDGKTVVRHIHRCSYDKKQLEELIKSDKQ